eukprot:6202223-Pleurochrysis_carterae.AAC.4
MQADQVRVGRGCEFQQNRSTAAWAAPCQPAMFEPASTPSPPLSRMPCCATPPCTHAAAHRRRLRGR